MARRARGDNVLPDQFQTVAVALTSDWCQKTQKFSGTNQKSERQRLLRTGLVRYCPQGLFLLSFTFLHAIFFRLFRLSLASTLCPWVSEDGSTLHIEHNIFLLTLLFPGILFPAHLHTNWSQGIVTVNRYHPI